ncbi:MAG: DMT family transporter [Saprospiraceae bacterium]
MQYVILLLVAFVAGVFLPLQTGLNTKIGNTVGNPVYAALISFVIGTIGLVVYLLVTRADFGAVQRAASLPFYYWLGGLIGAFYVAAVIILAPKLGTALTFGLTVAGQMLFSLYVDHLGLMGVAQHLITWQRVVGILLILGGVLLIQRF